jgi:heme-degrading monooxygenase HmoA
MFARVSTFHSASDRVEEATRYTEEKLIPVFRQMPGFKGWYTLLDRQTGKGLVISLWESEEAMRASEERAAQLRSQVTQDLPLQVQAVDRYEVTVQA